MESDKQLAERLQVECCVSSREGLPFSDERVNREGISKEDAVAIAAALEEDERRFAPSTRPQRGGDTGDVIAIEDDSDGVADEGGHVMSGDFTREELAVMNSRMNGETNQQEIEVCATFNDGSSVKWLCLLKSRSY